MIIQFFIDSLFNILLSFFGALPNISWNTDGASISTFFDFIEVILYLFPIDTVVVIFGLVYSLQIFKIVISLIKTIWDLLPFL